MAEWNVEWKGTGILGWMDDGHAAGMHAHVVVRLGQVDTGTDADALRTAESGADFA